MTKYGVRDRAYTQLVSGHYHINTLKVAMIQPPTFDDEVIVFNVTVTTVYIFYNLYRPSKNSCSNEGFYEYKKKKKNQ